MGLIIVEREGYKWSTKDDFEADRIAVDTALGLPNAAAETSMAALESLKEDGIEIEFYWSGCHPRITAELRDPITLQIRVEDGQ